MLMVVFSGLTVGEMMAVFGYLWFMMAPVQEVLNIQYALLRPKPRWGASTAYRAATRNRRIPIERSLCRASAPSACASSM